VFGGACAVGHEILAGARQSWLRPHGMGECAKLGLCAVVSHPLLPGLTFKAGAGGGANQT
jgi:hypothetical protein